MTERIALSLKPDFTAGRWDWSLAGEGFSLTDSVEAESREDAVVCVLAAAYDYLAALGPVAIVLSLVTPPELLFTNHCEPGCLKTAASVLPSPS